MSKQYLVECQTILLPLCLFCHSRAHLRPRISFFRLTSLRLRLADPADAILQWNVCFCFPFRFEKFQFERSNEKVRKFEIRNQP